MENKKMSLRLLPILGLLLVIAGYVYLTYSDIQLGKEIEEKKEAIANLDSAIYKKTSELASKKEAFDSIVNYVEENDPGLIPKIDSISKVAQKKIYELDESDSKHFKYTPIKETDPKLAVQWELKGFNYLLNQDVNSAIEAFIKSENFSNGYHMVYDIARYLEKNKESLSSNDDGKWVDCYRVLLKNYSWGMPTDIKRKIAIKAR